MILPLPFATGLSMTLRLAGIETVTFVPSAGRLSIVIVPMKLNQALADRKTQTTTFRFGLERIGNSAKGCKGHIDVIGTHPNAAIPHDNIDTSVMSRDRFYRIVPPGGVNLMALLTKLITI